MHLDDNDFLAALTEFRRILVPGAPLFGSVRHGGGEEVRRDLLGGDRWFKLYSTVTVRSFLEETGFDVSSCERTAGVRHGDWVNAHALRRVGRSS